MSDGDKNNFMMKRSNNITDKDNNYSEVDDSNNIDDDEDAFVNLDDPNIEVLDDDDDDISHNNNNNSNSDQKHGGDDEEEIVAEETEKGNNACLHGTQKVVNICKRTREQHLTQNEKQWQQQQEEEEEEEEYEEKEKRERHQRHHHEALTQQEKQSVESDSEEDDEANMSMNNHAESDVENLNEMSDLEPERDDAIALFTAPLHKPIHTITSFTYSANHMTLVAAAGEGEEVYVMCYHSNNKDHNNNNTIVGERELSDFTLVNHTPCQLELVQTLQGHTDTISQLQFSPNGEWLASAGLDSTIMVWRVNSECVHAPCLPSHTFTDIQGEIMSMLWHPSSLILVASSECAQSAMWNVLKGTLLMYFMAHQSAINTVVWSQDHKKLLMGMADGTVAQYSPKTGTQEWQVPSSLLSSDQAAVTTLCSVGVDQCVVGCEDGTLHVISLRQGKVVSHLDEVHEQAIESLKVNDLETLFISTSCDCHVVIWEVRHFSPRVQLMVGESVIPALWLSSFVFVVGCSDGALRSWDARSSEQKPTLQLIGHRRMILDLTCTSQDRFTVFTASDDGTVRAFRLHQ